MNYGEEFIGCLTGILLTMIVVAIVSWYAIKTVHTSDDTLNAIAIIAVSAGAAFFVGYNGGKYVSSLVSKMKSKVAPQL